MKDAVVAGGSDSVEVEVVLAKVEETIDVRHDGAALKDSFSR